MQFHARNVGLPSDSTPATLIYTAPDGSGQTTLGPIISIPQVCRASRPAGQTQIPANSPLAPFTPGRYGTPEWIREITYLDPAVSPTPANMGAARRWLGYHRITNSQYATGCGHMSKSVSVTKIGKAASTWFEQPYSANSKDMFNALVINPLPSNDGYTAVTIWISEQEWDTTSSSIQTQLAGVASRTLPISICP
jgi:hypothetical protein